MNCPNCGKDAGESRFCPDCGKPITEGDIPVAKTSNNKNTKAIAIIAAVVLVVAIVAIVIGKSFSKNENVKVEVSWKEATSTELESTEKEDSEKVIKNAIEKAKTLAAEGEFGKAIKELNSVTKTDEVSSLIQEYAKAYLNASDFGCYWIEDDVSDYHWAMANGQNNNLKNFAFNVYLHQNKAEPDKYGFHLFTSFTGKIGESEWIFPNNIRIKGDKNDAIDISVSLDNKSDIKNRVMYEWIDINISQEQFNEICKTANESSTITVRFTGSTYHKDFTLTAEQINYIKTIEKYGKAFGEVYGESEV